MKLLITSSLVSTYADSILNGISSVEVESKAIGSGGFGDVYIVSHIDGKSNSDLVLKIFKASQAPIHPGFQTIQKLQDRLSFKHDEIKKGGSGLLSLYPALRGLPLLSFEGLHGREKIFGYIMTNLKSIGFIELSDISSDKILKKSFLSMSIDKKVKMCLELVSSFKVLYDVFFLHADLKEDAFFVDPSSGSLIIIDYDGGVVLSNLGDKPVTVGTVQPWSAPEIKAKFIDRDKIQVSYFSELWSIAYCIHFIFFTWDPYFFFSEESENSFNEYNARFKWPEVDIGFSKVANYPAQYNRYLDYFKKNIPIPIQNKLSQTFSANNININRRTGYDEWLSVLSIGIKKPSIPIFKVSSKVISDENGIIVSWDATDAIEVTLDGKIVQFSGSEQCFSRKDHKLVLTAKGLDGTSISKEIQLTINKTPPQIVSFTSNTPAEGITSTNDITLSWKVIGASEIEIDNSIGEVSFLKQITVTPDFNQLSYTLTATSPFGFSSTKSLVLKINSSPPTIEKFDLSPNAIIKSINKPGILAWNVTNAQTVQLTDHGSVPHSGNQSILPRNSKIYTLTAIAVNGKAVKKDVRVEVLKIPPVIKKFKIDKYMINSLTPLHIEWEIEEAYQTILHPVGDVTGMSDIYYEVKEDTKFTLEAIGYFGGVTKSNRQVYTSKSAPLIKKFSASNILIDKPTPIELQWEVADSDKVAIDNGIGLVASSGNYQLLVEKDTAINLTASSPFGVQSKRKIRIKANKSNPIINVSYTPAIRKTGDPISISWKTYHTKKLTLDDYGDLPLVGTLTLNNIVEEGLLFTAEGHFGQSALRYIELLTL